MLALSSERGSRVEMTSIYHVVCMGLGDDAPAAFVCDKCNS